MTECDEIAAHPARLGHGARFDEIDTLTNVMNVMHTAQRL